MTDTPTRIKCPIKTHPTRRELKSFKKRSPIDHALYISTGKVSLDQESVRTYMAKKLDLLQNPPPIVQIIKEENDVLLFLGCAGIGLTPYIILVGNQVTVLISLIVIACILGAYKITKRQISYQVPGYARPTAAWEVVTPAIFKQIGRTIPQDVMTTIEEMEMRLPGAKTLIHYLYEDPFVEIVITTPDGKRESRFIEYWDESYI